MCFLKRQCRSILLSAPLAALALSIAFTGCAKKQSVAEDTYAYDGDDADEFTDGKGYGYSVRCVKD